MEIKELEELIVYHQNAYYNGNAEISDAEFDALWDELKEKDPTNKLIISKVGKDDSDFFPKTKHLMIMGSQEKANSKEEVEKKLAGMTGNGEWGKYKYMDINICAKKKGISEEKEIEKYYVNILKEQQGKRMKFDKIIMNPPYDNGLGGKITFETISLLRDDGNCICLMPLSNYKNKSAELWRYVKTFELADPKLFVDADITNNLCICTLENKNVDKYRSYEDIEMESYDPRFKVFYEVNSKLPLRYVIKRCHDLVAGDVDIETTVLETCRIGVRGFLLGGFGYKFNVLKDKNEPINSDLSGINMGTPNAKNNFVTWAYKKVYKDCLADKLMFGLNRLGSSSSECSIAIPQIDWETISDNPLWKEGKYDEAVLDVMDLMWDEDKNNIVRKK